MKFLSVILGCLFISSIAQADFLTNMLTSAIERHTNREKIVQAQADELVKRALKVKEDHETAARPYANELLNEAEKLSILAQASNEGRGKDLRYAESGISKKLPCNADLYATKDGVITLTLDKECSIPTADGSKLSVWDIQWGIEFSGRNTYCEGNICQIDYSKRK